MKNKRKNKLFNKAILFTTLTCLASTSIILIANKEQGIDLIVKEINTIKNKSLQGNIYPTAKVDPILPVTTIRKVKSDKKAINLLFLGDNFTKNSSKDLFSRNVYSKIVKYWLENPYPNTFVKPFGSYAGYDDTLATRFIFQTDINEKINIYSIQTISKEKLNNATNNSTSYLGLWNQLRDSMSMFDLRNSGRVKDKVLSYDLSQNFLEDGAIIQWNGTDMIFYSDGGPKEEYTKGRPNVDNKILLSYMNSAPDSHPDRSTDPTVQLHELGHLLFNLADEYHYVSSSGPNRSYISNPSDESTIPWKEFLNFRGIGIFPVTGRPNDYIPTKRMCKMAELGQDYCEVCNHAIAIQTARQLGDKIFYIADPQLTVQEDRATYKDNKFYEKDYFNSLDLYNFNIEKARDKHLEFRTVIDNQTLKERKVKLRVRIFNNNQAIFSEESQEYILQPGQIKGLCFNTTNVVPNSVTNYDYQIIGDVIDTVTNEVLATSLDRLNFWYFNHEQNNASIPKDPRNIYGRKLRKVTLKFVDSSTNQVIPTAKESVVIKREGEKYKKEKILFNGYQFDEAASNFNNGEEITVNNDITLTYKYRKLPSKTLKLKLIDGNNTSSILKTKNVTVYEGQTFTPQNSDFFLFDLDNFIGNSTANKEWYYSAEPSTFGTLSYDQITNNQEIVYKKIRKPSKQFVVKDQRLYVGQRYNLTDLNQSSYVMSYSYDDFDMANNIILNTIDSSTPGIYDVIFYLNNYDNATAQNITEYKAIKVEVKNDSENSLTPNPLLSELDRLNSITYLWIKGFENVNKITTEQFNNFNENNIWDFATGLTRNTNKFDYQIVEFKKELPSRSGAKVIFPTISFKIKITDKANQKSEITHIYSKYFNIDDTPPTPELDSEIARINSLSLTLKKTEFTQSEIDAINSSNILEQISNWVTTSGFAYQVTDFSKNNNTFTFSITATKDGFSKTSKKFQLPYTVKGTQPDEQQLIQQEIDRINSLSLSLLNNTFSQQEINSINQTNFSSQLANWNSITSNSKYKYEIVNFDKSNNNFRFNIKVTLLSNNAINKTSNTFNLSYSVSPDQPTIEEQLNNQKQRIDNLTLTLTQDVFDQSTLDSIAESNFSKWIQNWNSDVISSYSDFNFTIVKFAKSTNSFAFNIQITKENKSVESKQFQLAFTIKAIDQEVLNEKTRIESLDIKWNNTKTISSNDLIRWMNTPPTLEELSQYILNLDLLDQNKFNYKFTWLPYSAYTNDLTQGILRISVSLKNSSQSSAPAIIDKPITNILIQDNNGNKKNIMPILLGTLIPGGIIVVAVILVLTLIKKRRKY